MSNHCSWSYLCRSCVAASLVWLVSPQKADAQVVISEFLASNRTILSDLHRDFPDFIELYNTSDSAVDLKGWYVSDDSENPRKWTFPSIQLDPRRFLLVFASGKDLRDPTSELHTNFGLSRNGDFLALYRPDQSVAASFRPRYPPQQADASFGLSMAVTTQPFLTSDAALRYFVPSDGTLGTSWTEPEFDDTAWETGTNGIGYDTNAEPLYTDFLQTTLPRVRTSLLLRLLLTLPSTELGEILQLRMLYDSGFIAYLNGVEILRRNVPDMVSYRTRASQDRPLEEKLTVERISLTPFRDLLQESDNVLAVHVFNFKPADLFMRAEIDASSVNAVNPERVYFARPTPGWPNDADVRLGIASPPTFSVRSGGYTDPFTVELVAGENAEIRFTLDDSSPTKGSELYSEPILIERPTLIKVRAYQDGHVASDIVAAQYFLVGPSLVDFSSNLPLVVVTTRGEIPNDWAPAQLFFLEPGADSRSRLLDPPTFAGYGGMRIRGASTESISKSAYAVEFRDGYGDDRAVEVLGLPADSDYVLSGAFQLDPAHMRNPLMHELCRELGRHGVRTRFCEVYRSQNGAPLDYQGVYAFMERIKRGPARVPIQDIGPHHTQEPEISGGYMFKIDLADPGDGGVATAFNLGIRWVYPKETVVEAREGQVEWVRNYFAAYHAALNGPNRDDPETGYAAYIDVDSWIDEHLLRSFAKDADSFGRSSYFFKPRSGKLEYGPLWDLDRSLGSDDSRSLLPEGWQSRGFGWWGQLLADPMFYQRYTDRYEDLRRTFFSLEHVHGILDRMHSELFEAIERDAVKWSQVADRDDWIREVTYLKDWIRRRVGWMDTQILPAGEHIPGDINQDARLNIADVLGTLLFLFEGGVALPCEWDAGNFVLLDADGSGGVNLQDPVYTLTYLFNGGPEPVLGANCTQITGCGNSSCE